jgi:type VII secretion-associated serine protease mycosin
MSRIVIAALGVGVGVVAATQVPAVAAVAGPAAARSPRAPAASKPSPKPSKSTKPAKPAKPPKPSVPTPVATEPQPTQQCAGPGQASKKVTSIPWAQTELDWSSVWSQTEGQGVTVAVVDSGVDYNKQLAGRVTAIDVTGTGFGDCVGHGTEIAGMIAASDLEARGFPFVGVAPEARILSVKVNSQETGSSNLLAKGIEDAAKLHAQVINVSITTSNTSALRAAVQFALSQGAVIVAAGGNDTQTAGIGPFYPASYPGVLSVGGISSDGARYQLSDLHSRVAVTAPGVDVTSTCPGGYQVNNLQGTSYATAYVSGLAALLRSKFPKMSAAQVVNRIKSTANGGTGPGTGDGLINPLQAIDGIAASGAAASPAPSPRPQRVSVFKAPPVDQAAIDTSTIVTVSGVGGAALVAIGAVVVTHGRRRRWRAGPLPKPDADPEPTVADHQTGLAGLAGRTAADDLPAP